MFDRQMFITEEQIAMLRADGEAEYFKNGPQRPLFHWSQLITATRGRMLAFFRSPAWIM
jgi:hypothetical protein